MLAARALPVRATTLAAVASASGAAQACATRIASASAAAPAALRSFYTYNTPTDTKRIVLQDGSRLVFLKKTTGMLPTGATSSTDTTAAQAPAPGADPESIEALLPPRVRSFPRRSRLSDEQIDRMRQLRSQDPDTWTVGRLAREFDTFPGFVMRVTRCPPERVRMLVDKAQAEFDAMYPSEKIRAVNRMRRKALW